MRWVWALVILLGWGRLCGQELPGAGEKWRYFRSPHFDLYSCAAESSSRDVLFHLELVRHLMLSELALKEREKTPVTVYYFGKEKTFRAYLPDAMKRGDFVGLHASASDRARILISPTIDDDSLQAVVFHEYVHHLLRSSQDVLPPWLEEGIAEIYGALVVGNKTVEFGRPQPGRLMALQEGKPMIPLAQLFAADASSPLYMNGKHNGLFYAQSWALVHYWLYGQNKLPAKSGGNFINWIAANPGATGEEIKGAFEQFFGLDYAAMLSRLDSYRSRGNYRWAERPLPDVAPASTYEKREVSKEELHRRLAELALHSCDSALAAYLLTTELAAQPKDPLPYEAMGARAYQTRDYATAQEHWRKALELGSNNPAVLRHLTEAELASLHNSFDPANEMASVVREQLVARVKASIAADPDQISGYQSLAWLNAYARKPNWADVKQVHAQFGHLREREQVILAVAVCAWKLGDQKQALNLLGNVASMDPDMWTQQAAEVLRARIEGRPVNFSGFKPARREMMRRALPL